MNYSGDRILLGSQRESRISKFRPWVLFVIPLIAILFQIYVPRYSKFMAYLDMPLLVTVYFSLMRRSAVAGTFIGAFIGLAQDCLSTNPLGLYGIVKTMVGYFAASVGLRFDVDHPFIRLLLGFFFFFFHQFFAWVLFTWITNALYGIGIGNTNSILFLGFLYGAAAILYIVARFWRRMQGVDLDAIHAQIPAE